jgi:hypothetical protein
MEEKEKAQSALDALQDILESEAEWRGVPNVLRLAFRATHALARHSFELLATNDLNLANKVDKEDLKKAFKFKANIVDVEDSLEKVAEALESKVSVEDLEAVLENYVRRDIEKDFLDQKELSDGLELRIKKLENVAFALQTEEQHGYAKNFVTKAEFKSIENELGQFLKAEEFDEFKEKAITRPELDNIINSQLLPDLAEQMREIQKGTKDKLDNVIEELESRVNLDEFSVIRRDIERLLNDRDSAGGNSSLHSVVDQIRLDQVTLNQRLLELESLPDLIGVMKSDLKNMVGVNRDIQQNLNRISEEISNLPLTTRVNEIDHNLTSSVKSMEARLKRIEAAEKRTQDILEILSKSKLKDADKLDEDVGHESNRSRSFTKGYNPQMIEQVNEIKSYVDKKLRKIEAVYTKREDVDKLEDRIDDIDTSQNRIFGTLKEMIAELNSKIKISSKTLEEKVESKLRKDGTQHSKGHSKASVVAQLNDSSKVDHHNKSGSSVDKLKNLDELILKVSSLVSKKASEDKWKDEIREKVGHLEGLLDQKADKVKICKLLDRKAGKDHLNLRNPRYKQSFG